MKLKQFLRNEEGSSPGGGSAPPAPPTPPSEGTASAATAIPVDALKSVVAEALAGALPKFRDGIFADLRKSGALAKEKPAATAATTTPSSESASASTGLSMADVEAMLERERVITARATKHDLSDAAIRRMKASLQGVSPDQFASEADSFLADLGLVKAPTTTAQAPAALPSAPAQPPISDKGAPAPGGVLDWQRELQDRPMTMSAAAIARMEADLGVDPARRKRLEAAQRQASTLRVVTRPGG